jgi:6,7-dimethyl-8-ribityllumazine synthase
LGTVTQYKGRFSIPKGRFALVASRFNQQIVEQLVTGAKQGLEEHGVNQSAIDLVWVPGAFEIPLIAQILADTEKYLAVLGLGCVIRGETDHYQYICQAVSQGISQVALDTGLPVIFGVLTCDNEIQALDRAGGKAGNKGYDAALAALEMVTLIRAVAKE